MLEHEVSKVRARAVVPCDEHGDVSQASLVNQRRCSEGRRDSVSLAHANVSSLANFDAARHLSTIQQLNRKIPLPEAFVQAKSLWDQPICPRGEKNGSKNWKR